MKKAKLVKAAKELNVVLGLDPQIEIKDIDKEEMQVKILEAAELLVPEDEISEDTQDTIDSLKAAVEEGAGDDTGDVGEGETEPKVPKEPKAPKAPKAAKVPKEPKAPKTPRVTKKSVIVACLLEGATIEQMAQKMVDLGADPDLEKNLYVTKLWLRKMGYDTKKTSIDLDPIFKSA